MSNTPEQEARENLANLSTAFQRVAGMGNTGVKMDDLLEELRDAMRAQVKVINGAEEPQQ